MDPPRRHIRRTPPEARPPPGRDGAPAPPLLPSLIALGALFGAARAWWRRSERLARVLQGTGEGYWELDLEKGDAFYSRRFAEMLDYGPGEIASRSDAWERLVHEEDLPGVRRDLMRHLAGETAQFTSTHRKRRSNGDYLWVQARGRVVRRDRAGRAQWLAGADSDVSEQVRRERRLDLRAAVFAHSGEAIFITDERHRILSVNPAFSAISGYGEEEVVGRDPEMLAAEPEHEGFRSMREVLAIAGHWQGEIEARRRDGEVFPLWAAVTAARDREGRVRNYIGICADISERKSAEQRIQYLAHHDVLTGLPNRILLRDRLDQVLAHVRRARTHAAVLFLDLDRFKNVNDSFGHHVGDELLKQAAERLRNCVRMDDIVSRQGGDEFVLALSELREPADAAHVAQKIADSVARPFLVEGQEIRITASIGIALAPEDGTDPDTLVRNADAAMYYAKERGRNNYQFFIADLNQRARRRISLENSLRRAVDQGDFVLHFQPQIDVRTSALVGVEALVRWVRGERLIYPTQFIPLAEETGLILPLGEWVLEQACRQQREWQSRGFPNTPLAVNISAVQFHNHESLARLRAIVAACPMPEYLEMELTESALMEDAEGGIAELHKLREMGVSLAIDDFGTGYSSLSYLRRLPVNRIKVDQSFVRELPTDAADRAITEAIISLGRSLNLKVTAEGVERPQEIVLLRERHCDELQGYYFSPPLPPEEFMRWWRGRLETQGRP